MMTDFQRVKSFYDFLNAKYEIQSTEEQGADKSFVVGEKDDWYWTVYLFKGEKLIHWYVTE